MVRAALQTLERAWAADIDLDGLVIANATPEDIEGLKAQTREFERAIVAKMTAKQLRILDLQFHKLLLDATHNSMFSRLGHAVMTAFACAEGPELFVRV